MRDLLILFSIPLLILALHFIGANRSLRSTWIILRGLAIIGFCAFACWKCEDTRLRLFFLFGIIAEGILHWLWASADGAAPAGLKAVKADK